MKNKEFYKDKIYEVACKHDVFAVNKKTGEVTNCKNLKCGDCLFNPFKHISRCGYCDDQAMEWLEEEHVETLLTEKEKQYLEAVLMPYKNRVLYVAKYIYNTNKASLEIRIKSLFGKNCQESVILPYFDDTKMYTGMEKNKCYTLEELGLFK